MLGAGRAGVRGNPRLAGAIEGRLLGDPEGGGLGKRLKEAGTALRDRALLRRVARQFVPYKREVIVVAVLILVTAGLGVTSPLLIRLIFDKALFIPGGPDLSLLSWLVALMIIVPAIASAVGVYQAYVTNRVGQSVMRDLRASLYEHLQRLSLRFFTATRTGEIQSRLANDVGGLQTVITDTASTILSNSVILISTIIAMSVLSWQLTVLSLALLPLFVFLTGVVGRARRRVVAQTQKSLAEMSAITEETLSVSGVLLAKVFGRQEAETRRYVEQNERLAGLQVRQQMIGRAFFAMVSTFFSIMPALVYLIAGFTHGITPGTLVAFTTLQARLFMPIGQLLQTSTEISSSLALFERVFGYLDLTPDIVEPERPTPLPAPARGHVSLDGVWFSYQDEPEAEPDPDAEPGDPPVAERRWAVRDLTLDIPPGTLAAIVGPSGAGKTTISYLVPRLYDPSRGTVRLDGIDARELSFADIADAVGMVTQESYLFHASIADNLRYARPDATQEEIEAAARAAQIHDRIMEFEDGYDTTVGERGYRLSGGEKQRVAIARTILKDPRVLILDEATSALDTANERLVQAALAPLMAGRTTIAIAHRLSTIRSADVIYVMDNGHPVESGTHDELLAVGGRYAELYDQQFGGGLVEARCADGVVLSSGQILDVPTGGAERSNGNGRANGGAGNGRRPRPGGGLEPAEIPGI
jgi:ATP-binding cassette, subfamily B, bacterial